MMSASVSSSRLARARDSLSGRGRGRSSDADSVVSSRPALRISGACMCVPATFCVLVAVFAGTLAAAVVTWRHYTNLRDSDLWIMRACTVLGTRVSSLPAAPTASAERRFRAEADVVPDGVPGKVTAFWGRKGSYTLTEAEANKLVESLHKGEHVACWWRRSEPREISLVPVPRERAPTEDVYLNMAWGSSFFAAISGFLVVALGANFAQRGILAVLGAADGPGDAADGAALKQPTCLTSVQAKYVLQRFGEDSAEDAWTCSICLEDEEGISANRAVVLPCKHRYHARCVRKWLRRGAPTCPLCNWNVQTLFDENGAPVNKEEVNAGMKSEQQSQGEQTQSAQEAGGSVDAGAEGEADEFADIAVPAAVCMQPS